MKRKLIFILFLILLGISWAHNSVSKYTKTNNKTRIDTLQTINSFSKLHNFYTINYSGDYEQLLDYLDQLYIGALSQTTQKFGCSIFSGLGDSENIFLGRNFDNPQQDVLVGKYSSPNCYESIALNRLADIGLPLGTDYENLSEYQQLLLLRSPYFAADGMNEMGVAAALAYVQEVNVEIDPDKQTIYLTRWVREILDHADSVDEAVEITNSFNIIDNMFGNNTLCHHLQVTDSTGESAILEYHDGHFVKIEPDVDWQILTNTPIYNIPLEVLFSQCYRYELLYHALQDQNGIISDWRNGLDILELPTWGNISNGTQWSNLFDLNEKIMYLSLYRNFDNIVQVDVENFEFRNFGDYSIMESYADEDMDGFFEPGETIDLTLFLSVDFVSTGVIGTINCTDTDICLINSTSNFGEINPGEIVTNADNPFRIEISENALPQQIDLMLSLCTDYNYTYQTELSFIVSSSSSEQNTNISVPERFSIHNFPNPFNPSTTFSLDIPNESNVGITIFNTKGQMIKKFKERKLALGKHSITWDGTDKNNDSIPSGMYLYQVTINGKSRNIGKCLLIK